MHLDLNSCLSLLPVRLLIGLLPSEAQCYHLTKGVTDANLQGDFEDKIVCVLGSCSHLPKPPGDVLCTLCPTCSDIFPFSRLPPKALPLCQVPFPRIYLCSENPYHTVTVNTFTTCSWPRNRHLPRESGGSYKFPTRRETAQWSVSLGTTWFLLPWDRSVQNPNKGLNLGLSLRKTTNQTRNIQPPDLQSQISHLATY